jgi:dipeptidyl-peptidase-4
MIKPVFGVWLSYEEAVLNSPFKEASLGWTISVPNEDAYVYRGKGDNWKLWYKVSLPSMDTTLFLDSTTFALNSDDLYVSGLSFAKSGDKLLVKTDSRKIWRHSNSGTYFIYNLSLGTLIPVSDDNKNLRNVKISPDGKLVAYVREDNNLYIYEFKRKRERRLTSSGSKTILNGHFGWLYEEELTGYDGYRWSPDSESIAFWEENEAMVPEFTLFDEMGLYPKIQKIRYPKAGETNPTLRIGILRVKGGGRKWIQYAQVGDDYLPWMEWVNNEKVAFLKMDRKQKNWDIFIADRQTGRSLKVLSESDPDGWLDNHDQIKFMKDGKILWISENSGYKHIWIAKHSGSNFWPITKGVSAINYIDEDAQKIYFTANKESVFENRFYSIRVDGTELNLLTPEEGSHYISISGSKKYFTDTFSSLTVPRKILYRDLESGKIIKVLGETDLEQYEEYEWSTPKIVHFPTKDNTENLDGIITLPPNYSKTKKYPVIMYGYGMPGTQIVWNRWGRTWNQYLAQLGYIVFSMDSRGMSGRGEEFKNLSYGDMAHYLAKDHLAGLNYLVDEGYADPERIGAWGWSGGGYFTCLMLTKNGKYFKAGVSVAPVTDFRLYDTAYTERSMGLPEENKAGYDSTSVITWMNRMQGSILLMHATGDDNVHSQNTTHFVQAALKAGKDVEWFQYPNRSHGIYGNGSREHLYKKMIEFFKAKL